VGAIVKVDKRHYRKIAQENWGLTDEQMKGMHVHHRIPRSQGGTDAPTNLYVCSPWFHANVWHGENARLSFIEQQQIACSLGGKNNLGVKRTKTARLNLSLGAKRRYSDPIERKKTSIRMLGNKSRLGLKDSAVTRKKKSESNLNNRVTCPHCGLTSHPGTMTRWHFDKCKHK
jgi:hypothetical protein